MRFPSACLAFVLFGLASLSPRAVAGERLLVHEWGTFTALQAEDGRAVAGINTDDEPLPEFVHNLSDWLLVKPTEAPSVFFKGTPRVHPDVLVRLETPVIYFYPPDRGPAANKPLKVNVEVFFRGGWLTEFYPKAEAVAPGVDREIHSFGHLKPDAVGSLTWRNVEIGGTADGPATDSKAWLAPRQVKAASVRTPAGETERYLFYRGVANLPAPLQVKRLGPADEGKLQVHARYAANIGLPADFAQGKLWLLDVREDGKSAFTSVDANATAQDKPIATLPGTFPAGDYAADRLPALRKAMHAALVAEGLFPDEADALLNTWDAAYFRRPGQRLFFLVPQQWTESVMPLRVSTSAEIRRVMVGRIELVTPAQREKLKAIAAGPVSNQEWVQDAMKKAAGGSQDYYRESWFQDMLAGKRTLTSLNIAIPNDYRAYLELGRFRNAIILDELRTNPSPNLGQFVKQYNLQGHEPGAGR